ncbi:small integral membrane protein 4 [Sapajus apella]|nr:small integral membrane protein 4 [Sapajus apella]
MARELVKNEPIGCAGGWWCPQGPSELVGVLGIWPHVNLLQERGCLQSSRQNHLQKWERASSLCVCACLDGVDLEEKEASWLALQSRLYGRQLRLLTAGPVTLSGALLALFSSLLFTRALQYSDWRLPLAFGGRRPAPALVRVPVSGGGRCSLVAQAAVHGENARGGLGCVRAIQCVVPPYPSPRPRSSMFPKAQVRRILQRVPGKRRFGIYRFLPFFFVLGGTMEWIMINIRVGQETFYDVYRRKASERQYQRRLEDE